MSEYHYLYKITNMVNNKIYIGQTTNPTKRWYQHCWFAKNPEKSGQAISYAIAKHGKDAFHLQVIATCNSYEDANATEAELIKQYDSLISNGKGYNEALGGNNAPWSQDRKEQMSLQMKAEGNHFYGKTHSDETKAKMSTAKKGKPSTGKMTDKCHEAAIKANTGRKQSAETLALRFTDETKQKMRLAKLGKKQSKETLAKRFSPEARLRMSIAAKNRKRTVQTQNHQDVLFNSTSSAKE